MPSADNASGPVPRADVASRIQADHRLHDVSHRVAVHGHIGMRGGQLAEVITQQAEQFLSARVIAEGITHHQHIANFDG